MNKDYSVYSMLPAKVHPFKNGMENWLVISANEDGYPCKLFIINNEIQENINLSKGCTVYKYDVQNCWKFDIEIELESAEKLVFENIIEPDGSGYYSLMKMINGFLIEKMPIVQVIQLIRQFDLPANGIHNWKAGIIRILKTYILDGTRIENISCSICNAQSMIYREGDLCCNICGYSSVW